MPDYCVEKYEHPLEIIHLIDLGADSVTEALRFSAPGSGKPNFRLLGFIICLLRESLRYHQLTPLLPSVPAIFSHLLLNIHMPKPLYLKEADLI